MSKFNGDIEVCGKIKNTTGPLQFEDTEIIPPVSLKKLVQDHHASWNHILSSETVLIEDRKDMRVKRILRNFGVIDNRGVLTID